MSDDQTYLGMQDQGTEGTEFNARTFHIQQEISKVNTATLVKIVRAPYDKNGSAIDPGSVVPVGYVDVQPLVNQLDGRGQATPHGTVFRLSYHRFQGGVAGIIFDPVVGDIGKMVVADRDTSSVRATNDVANPGSRRKFDKADGTFFGSTQQKDPPTKGIRAPADGLQWFDEHGWKITSNADGIKLEAKGNTIIMGDSGVLINGALINKSGDVITAAGHDLDTHTHGGVQRGGSHTDPPS
jgi:hypothetical protein